ncbi:MAG: hypothetical protein VCB60_09200 [Alphaproteobacteria bacterium]
MSLLGSTAHASDDEHGGHWYDWFWPIGAPVHVEALSHEYIPFKGEGEIPDRPKLMIELGDAFLGTGLLNPGFTVPIIGAVWQPRLWAYVVNRTTIQSFDDGAVGRERDTEISNRMDLFANLQLTGTEKILLGLRPTDNNSPSRFTRYTFNGADEDFKNEFNVDIETLFFEGDVGSLVPNLDKAGITPIDFGFTVGRQAITFQEGVLINDTVDMIGFNRNNLSFPGASNLRVQGMWAWDRLDRNDRVRGSNANMFALFTAVDGPVSTFNWETIYVADNAADNSGDALYIGLASIQRMKVFGRLGVSTAFRVNSSFALDNEISGNVLGDGTLLTGEFSFTPHGSHDIAYFNPFLAVGNFTQAGREAIVGGPLANTGILFASPNLSTHGAEINPFVDDDVGFAVGYQAFWQHGRRNLVLELATKKDYSGSGNDSLALGYQLQQAVGQHIQLNLESFYTFNDTISDGAGARFEVLVVY